MHVESRSQPLSYKPSESTGRPFASIVQRNSFTAKPVASKYVAPLASTSAAGLALRVVDYIGDGVQVVSLGVESSDLSVFLIITSHIRAAEVWDGRSRKSKTHHHNSGGVGSKGLKHIGPGIIYQDPPTGRLSTQGGLPHTLPDPASWCVTALIVIDIDQAPGKEEQVG